jgi:hypothetical protein
MIKSLVSIVIAAACAAVFVGFVPPPAPAVAAAQSPQQPVTSAVKPVAAAGPVADIHNAGCVQAWPYYEQSCLHDRRGQNGSSPTHVVRVIAVSERAAIRTLKVQR